MNLFQERLENLLEQNNLSRLALSKKLGCTSTTINGYFNNDYYPEISIAVKMAQFFNCNLSYLFGLSEDKEVRYELNEENFAKNFFNNFSKILKSHKMPISKAMPALNMGIFNYYRWRDGQLPMTSNIVKIAEYFDVSVDYLLGHE